MYHLWILLLSLNSTMCFLYNTTFNFNYNGLTFGIVFALLLLFACRLLFSIWNWSLLALAINNALFFWWLINLSTPTFLVDENAMISDNEYAMLIISLIAYFSIIGLTLVIKHIIQINLISSYVYLLISTILALILFISGCLYSSFYYLHLLGFWLTSFYVYYQNSNNKHSKLIRVVGLLYLITLAVFIGAEKYNVSNKIFLHNHHFIERLDILLNLTYDAVELSISQAKIALTNAISRIYHFIYMLDIAVESSFSKSSLEANPFSNSYKISSSAVSNNSKNVAIRAVASETTCVTNNSIYNWASGFRRAISRAVMPLNNFRKRAIYLNNNSDNTEPNIFDSGDLTVQVNAPALENNTNCTVGEGVKKISLAYNRHLSLNTLKLIAKKAHHIDGEEEVLYKYGNIASGHRQCFTTTSFFFKDLNPFATTTHNRTQLFNYIQPKAHFSSSALALRQITAVNVEAIIFQTRRLDYLLEFYEKVQKGQVEVAFLHGYLHFCGDTLGRWKNHYIAITEYDKDFNVFTIFTSDFETPEWVVNVGGILQKENKVPAVWISKTQIFKEEKEQYIASKICFISKHDTKKVVDSLKSADANVASDWLEKNFEMYKAGVVGLIIKSSPEGESEKKMIIQHVSVKE